MSDATPQDDHGEGGAPVNDPQYDPATLADRLVSRLQEYNSDADPELIRKSVMLAAKWHEGQTRKSGEPYFTHPVEVAEILTEFHMDPTSIITAVLHDTVEDTEATLEDIEQEFDATTARLVDGVTKLGKLEFQSPNQRQAENFQKFVVAISEDIRVLIVKLADRLHNMRTLHHIDKPEKRARIAHETMEIYAPLAERIGMQRIKNELQNIAFRELNEDAYRSIHKRLEYLKERDATPIDEIINDIARILDERNVPAHIFGRQKMPYSIWHKMQRKNIGFEQLSDIIAFRVIVEKLEDCYLALGAIHAAFHSIPEYFKDYISTPKKNGYQSLHTVVMGPQQQRIEMQIRTQEMHEIAEFGVAAHWTYKQEKDYNLDGKQYQWVRELLHILEQTSGAEEFFEHTKLEMYHDQVFCFSPKGDLIALPRDATPVDFAFAVHSEVGMTCAGAKVNGRIVPLRTKLQNGDQVEILQSKTQHPSPAWENFVVTGKARSEVRRYIRQQESDEYIKLGKAMMERAVERHGKKLTDKLVEPILKQFGKKKPEDLFLGLGEGSVERRHVIEALFPDAEEREEKKRTLIDRLTDSISRGKRPESNDKLAVPIVGLIPGMAIHYAGCCHPLPGEKIVGIVNSGKGVTIHAANCGELENFYDQPERWIDVSWEEDEAEESMFIGRLRVVLENERGALGAIANVIGHHEGNIYNLRIVHRGQDFFETILDVEVRSVSHFSSIIANLRKQSIVNSVDRYYEGRA